MAAPAPLTSTACSLDLLPPTPLIFAPHPLLLSAASQVERRGSASATYINSMLGNDSGVAVEQKVAPGGRRLFLATLSAGDAQDRRTT